MPDAAVTRDRSGRAARPARLFLLAILGGVASGIGTAHAQTRDQIREQNEQLYEQQQGLAASPDSGAATGAGGGDASAGTGAGQGGLTAQLLDRVDRLESEVRSMQGRMDELERSLDTKTAALNKQIGDAAFAAQQAHAAPAPAGDAGSGAAAGTPAPAAPARTAAAAPAPAAHRTPEASLKLGNALIARHDYAGAEQAAQDALDGGHGVHGADAEFLLGQSYAGQKNYQQAAVAFYGAYGKSPHGPLAQDALLRVGGAMMALGQNGAACEAFSKLKSEFPTLRPSVARSVASMRHGAHC